MDIRLNEVTRKELWNEINSIVEFRLRELNGIFQNEIPITPEVIRKFGKEKDLIIDNLNNIEKEFLAQVRLSLEDNIKNKQ